MSEPKKKPVVLRSEPLPDISSLLIVTKEGTPKPLLANAITMLRYDPAWSGVLGFNEFSLHVTTRKAPPWAKETGETWVDHDDSLCAEWLQHAGILVTPKVAGEAVQVVARDYRFHPVRDYLKSRKWDDVARLDTWLTVYLGVADSPFVSAVGSRWLISAVARIFRPGCQVDHVLLLESPQGWKKSSVLRELAGDEWFADHLSELGSKDSRLVLHGKWIFEMGEMDRVRRGELERVKAYLTARIDHFRLPYARRAEDVPRSCVFAASTNDRTPLVDETGNRRFWPVRCGRIDLEAMIRDRNQIWAEAYARYQAGAPWWLETDELDQLAKTVQDEQHDQDLWHDAVMSWATNPKQARDEDGLPLEPFDSIPGMAAVTEVLLHAIGKPLDQCTQQDKNRVGRCLRHEGWTSDQERKGPLRGKRFYYKPSDGAGTDAGQPAVHPNDKTLPRCPACGGFALYRGQCETCRK